MDSMTVAATAPKRRTRKAAPKKPVVKVTQVEVKAEAPIRTLKPVKRPSASKLITPQRYWSDIKTRWAIHNYEITMLVSDLTKFNNWVRQFAK